MKHKTTSYAHKEKEGKSIKYLLPLSAALAIIIMANVLVISQSNKEIDSKIKYAEDLAKPANLEITEITAQCSECFNVSAIVSAIKQFKASFTEKTLDSNSADAKALISKYNITRLPSVVVTGDIEKSGLGVVWSNVGTKESDGTLVLRIGAPYMDTSSGEIKGKVSAIFLNDSACKACYDVNVHKSVLERFGVNISGESTVDVTSSKGKTLIVKYNITKVPTVLVSPDAKYYESLQGIWKQVGSIEADGWYVFRNMGAMNGATYYDLALNKTINATISNLNKN